MSFEKFTSRTGANTVEAKDSAPSESSEREYRKILNQLKNPIRKILGDLRVPIEQGAYNAIIGDDASGRIPTLILSEVIKRVYAQYGHKAPVIRFMTSPSRVHHDAQKENIQAHVSKILKDAQNSFGDGKALLVTDVVWSGKTLSRLMDGIRANGWNADVATVGFVDNHNTKREVEETIGAPLINGSEETPAIYNRKYLSGVTKNRKDIFASPAAKKGSSPKHQISINFARKVSHEIASELFEMFIPKYDPY